MGTDEPKGSARRIACVEPCEIEGAEAQSGMLWNVSGRGVYLVLPTPLAEGRTFRISFTLPGEERAVQARARVAWVNPPSRSKGQGERSLNHPAGCGLEFVEIADEDLELIEAHIRRTPLRRGNSRE
jgi:hypothetical protein